MSTITERILKYIDYKGITKYKFCKDLDVSGAFLDKPREITTDKYANILAYYPEINPEWLLTGNGEMLKGNPDQVTVRELRTDYKIDQQNVPLYDLVASAGVLEIFGEGNLSVPLDYIRIPNLPKCDGALYVRGDSMYPLLKSGDIVMYRVVHDKAQIIWGEMYLCHLISNGDEYFFTKFIKKSDKEGFAVFVSQNQHHQPVEFPIDSIRSLAIVKASIRINSQI